MKISKTQQDVARAELLDPNGSFGGLKPGDTVYCILRKCNASGMSRDISFAVMVDGQPCYLDYQMSQLGIANRVKDGDGLRVSGCGMDMGFAMVYDLGRRLFPEGFGIEQEGRKGIRPKDEAHAKRMVARGCKFFGRNGDASGWDNDGGYALKHRWL